MNNPNIYEPSMTVATKEQEAFEENEEFAVYFKLSVQFDEDGNLVITEDFRDKELRVPFLPLKCVLEGENK